MKDTNIIEHSFAPVISRRQRCDGWTPEVQLDFIEALAMTGSVTAAARAVNRHFSGAYRLRTRPEAGAFRAAWAAASANAYHRLHDLAMDRVVNGTEQEVLNDHGQCIYRKTVHDNKLLMFLMNHLKPVDAVRREDVDTDMLASALVALEVAPVPMLLSPALATFEFTPEEAEALARYDIVVDRIAPAPPENDDDVLDLVST